jgi:hypothetical protein
MERTSFFAASQFAVVVIAGETVRTTCLLLMILKVDNLRSPVWAL